MINTLKKNKIWKEIGKNGNRIRKVFGLARLTYTKATLWEEVHGFWGRVGLYLLKPSLRIQNLQSDIDGSSISLSILGSF